MTEPHNSKSNSSAVNLIALTSIQVSNAAMPLVVFPYVLGVVGAESYARLVVAESITQVVATFVLYSFELDGIAWVVGLHSHDDRPALSKVFSEILVSRAIIFVLSAVLFAGTLVWLSPDLLKVFLPWLLVPLGTVIQPSWLYQGLQRTLPLAIFNVGSRVIAVVLVMLLVDSSTDYSLVPLLIGVVYFSASLISVYTATKLFGVSLQRVSLARVKQVVWFGREVFFANASVLLSRDVNVIVLASAGVAAPGIAAYSLAEKLLKGLQAAMRPLNQLALPRTLLITKRATGANRTVLAEMQGLVLPQILLLALIVVVLSLSYIALGERIPAITRLPNLDRAEMLTAIMLCATFLGVVNFMLGMGGLTHLNARKYYFKAVLASGVLGATICALSAPVIGEIAAALNVIVFETVLCVLVVRKYLIGESKDT